MRSFGDVEKMAEVSEAEREFPLYRICSNFPRACGSRLNEGVRATRFKARIVLAEKMKSTREVFGPRRDVLRSVGNEAREGLRGWFEW